MKLLRRGMSELAEAWRHVADSYRFVLKLEEFLGAHNVGGQELRIRSGASRATASGYPSSAPANVDKIIGHEAERADDHLDVEAVVAACVERLSSVIAPTA